jgi:hypothetical protein
MGTMKQMRLAVACALSSQNTDEATDRVSGFVCGGDVQLPVEIVIGKKTRGSPFMWSFPPALRRRKATDAVKPPQRGFA